MRLRIGLPKLVPMMTIVIKITISLHTCFQPVVPSEGIYSLFLSFSVDIEELAVVRGSVTSTDFKIYVDFSCENDKFEEDSW